jgi:hypothetical protein
MMCFCVRQFWLERMKVVIKLFRQHIMVDVWWCYFSIEPGTLGVKTLSITIIGYGLQCWCFDVVTFLKELHGVYSITLPKVLHGVYSVLLSRVRTHDLVFELI